MLDAKKKKTIFLLEDDESFSIVFTRWLKEAGYDVISARTISEARKYLGEQVLPSLFWLDYYLEGDETGEDFLKELRLNARFKDIPIILVSITIDAKKLEEFKALGATAAFSKELTNRDEILATIKQILGD